jgi:taurine dioxygenase
MQPATGHTLEITPLTESIGAEVSGLDPAAVSLYDRAVLRAAWHQHHVLVFRGMPLTEDQQIDLASSFGTIRKSSAPATPLATRPEIMVVSNIRDDGGVALGTLPDGEMDWHYDGLHQSVPYTGGILHSIEVPSSGGETRFANMCRVYASLPAPLKERLTGLHAQSVYDFAATDRSAKVRDAAAPTAVHPVVRFHEQSKQNALFVCRLMTERILELPEGESTALLEELFGYIERSPHFYEHAWRAGDTVVWDNRCVTHARNDFDPKERRYLKRVSVVS